MKKIAIALGAVLAACACQAETVTVNHDLIFMGKIDSSPCSITFHDTSVNLGSIAQIAGARGTEKMLTRSVKACSVPTTVSVSPVAYTTDNVSEWVDGTTKLKTNIENVYVKVKNYYGQDPVLAKTPQDKPDWKISFKAGTNPVEHFGMYKLQLQADDVNAPADVGNVTSKFKVAIWYE